MIDAIVDTTFVAEHPQCIIVDVRWYLDGRDGRAAYEAAHLPGAIWVDLERDLAGHDLPATEGRHPFPSPADFAARMGDLGIGDGTTVMAYDDTGGVTAGRLVVMLRMLGHDAAVLDGGLTNWSGPVHTGWVEPTAASFTARPWPADRLASADEATRHGQAKGAVIDARSRERFTGELTQIDPRPGHIPGARSAPWTEVVDANGRFKTAPELRSHFEALGMDTHVPAIAYCGSGISACMNVLAIERAGLPAPRLYVASWSGWSADTDRPVELGE